MSLDVVILAAGQGTRMRSAVPKVLHPIAGKPMLSHVIETAQQLNPKKIHVVVGHGAQEVQQQLADDTLNFITQAEQLGTGHAVAQTVAELSADYVLVLYGDVPLTRVETLQALLQRLDAGGMSLLTVCLDDPRGYGRIVRDATGQVQAIVEHKDATPEQLRITEGNSGILVAPREQLLQWLARLSNSNAQGEYYLTDVIAMAVADGVPVETEIAQDSIEVLGANDRLQLAQLERYYQRRQTETLMQQGVTLLDPQRVDVRGEVTVGRDITIDVNVILEGRVIIEDQVSIGPNTVIKDSILRRGAQIKANCHLDGAEVGEAADCGPFARLRPGTVLAKHVHVGNFVELKNTVMGEAAKAGHLSYLGDSEVGARTNIGAGTITCNYDGANKFKTIMGEDVFIGSNTSLVAPLLLDDGCTTAAGSTITVDVPKQGLAVGRGRQRNVEGWRRPVKKTVK